MGILVDLFLSGLFKKKNPGGFFGVGLNYNNRDTHIHRDFQMILLPLGSLVLDGANN